MKGQDAIDILKLYAEWDTARWNQWLLKQYRNKNSYYLLETIKNLQLGMDQLAKQKLNSEKISITYCRWIKSIENTLKAIYRDDNDNPLYDPNNSHLKDKHINDKRRKDHEFEKFIKKSSW